MLAGVIFSAVAVMWLAYLVPWFSARMDAPHDAEADPNSIQLSESGRILRQGILDAGTIQAEVSTPLIRKAAMAEIRLIARTAATRRRRVLLVLVVALTLLAGLWAASLVPWWTTLIPVGLIVVFLFVARFSVVAMHRKLHARAEAVMRGWECEDTDIIVLADHEDSVHLDLSVDLATANLMQGSLWDPIPVTAPTYVSQPLAPRTVRTIDLNAPILPPVVTADALADTQGFDFRSGELRPKAVNE